ncbi:hypothetical protein LPB41_01430 [Thalassospira sp. MA62]|nr:hypothetical protein [Thalassospira sp. MA62]
MVVGFNPAAINHLQANTQQANQAAQQNENMTPRGVGNLQKMWLHVRGKAGAKHSEQLGALRAHVSNKFGDVGLAALNKELADKKLDGDKSTKLFSSSDLKQLTANAKSAALRHEYGPENAKAMRTADHIDARNAASTVRNSAIDATTNVIINTQGDQIRDQIINGSDVSRLESMQKSEPLQAKADEIVDHPGLSKFIKDAMPYMKHAAGMNGGLSFDIQSMINLANTYLVAGADQQIPMNPEIKADMESMIGDARDNMQYIFENGTTGQQNTAARDFANDLLQDAFSQAVDTYFDRLDNCTVPQGQDMLELVDQAVPAIARDMATQEVDDEIAQQISDHRREIQDNVRGNMDKRADYPEINNVISQIIAFDDTIPTDQLELIDLLADFADSSSHSLQNSVDDLSAVVTEALDPNAAWASDLPVWLRNDMANRMNDVNAAKAANDHDLPTKINDLQDTLEQAKGLISLNFYESHLSENGPLSVALDEAAMISFHNRTRDEQRDA